MLKKDHIAKNKYIKEQLKLEESKEKWADLSQEEKDERMNQWKEKKIVWKNLSKAEKKAKKKEWAS